MPEGLRHIQEFIAQNRAFVIAGGVVFALFVTALITLILALKRSRKMRTPLQEKKAAPAEVPVNRPKIQRTKLAIGDVASPWTQGIYERHSPEGKINALLPAFAFDDAGGIHRVQEPALIKGVDLDSVIMHCNTAAGVAVHGAYATLALWHAGYPAYVGMAFKVASHAHMAAEQKELIRFLFQDVTGQKVIPLAVPGLKGWHNPVFQAAIKLYSSVKISPASWAELEKVLPQQFRRFYELELAQKLPAKMIYKQASTSPVFAEGLYLRNLACLVRYMSTKRWQRVRDSGKAARFTEWFRNLPCVTEADALLQIANPDVYEKEDLPADLAEKIPDILAATPARDWLFNQGKQPRLNYRLHYFKFFCLFGRHNEAVRCFATLGIFRKDRAMRLYYARALFSCGMQHEAWAEMSALLAAYPRDAAVMNEAAIYAHKLGRHDEAAEIFSLARGMYPDDATLAYNEAVFTEQFSRVQIKEKWDNVQKLSDPPVVTE